MGTGEAEGEKRALTAAEAAISNPLIDDASMKGAKGLLISITGGRDLTLYEVDEAATRIREEVDQDANIIVGATFDEGLDGIIRVSVVATGIDQASAQRPAVRRRRRRGSPRSRSGCAPTTSGWRNASNGPSRAPDRCRLAPAAPPPARLDDVDRIRPRRRSRRRSCRMTQGGRHDPAARAQAVAVHRPGRERAGAAGAGGVHSAAAGAPADPRAAHAANRRTAGPGAERDSRPARRDRTGGAPGEATHVAVAAARGRRSRPPRARRGGAAAQLPERPGRFQQPSTERLPGRPMPRPEFAAGAGLRIRQASGAAGSRPARTAGTCA